MARIPTVQARRKVDPAIQEGVVIDSDGVFVAKVQWEKKRKRPNLQRLQKTSEKRLSVLVSEKALDVPAQNARWDFDKQEWMIATAEIFMVHAQSGVFLGKRTYWPDLEIEEQEGVIFVDQAPPKLASQKPVYNQTTDQWDVPRRVALINSSGEVENVVLEHPCDSVPDVEVPEEYTRIDERGEWPVDTDGKPIAIGSKLVGGKWLNKQRRREAEAT